MKYLGHTYQWLALLVLSVLVGVFAWQMSQLLIVTEAMLNALESALEARQ